MLRITSQRLTKLIKTPSTSSILRFKMAESAQNDEPSNKRPQFGNRLLRDEKDVFEHNAWDNVTWDSDQEDEAREKVAKNSQTKFTDEKREQYETDADNHWNKFYNIHQNRFFKDRHWLFTEFPELAPSLNLDNVRERVHLDEQGEGKESELKSSGNTTSESTTEVKSSPDSESQKFSEVNDFPGSNATYRVFEVGCGAGNTVFPVLRASQDPNLFVYCCDFSSVAVDIVRENQDFESKRCYPFVCDVSNDNAVFPFPENSLDVIVMIFVLSAMEPGKMPRTIEKLAKFLRPGGMILLRDYGRFDMAQLRFKDGACIDDHFYARGDGTRCYFFTQEELREMMTGAGLEEVQNLVDRRLQVNRGKQLKMYRVWVQCKYRKPLR